MATVMTVPLEKLRKKAISLEDEQRQLEKTNDELMGTYGEQNTPVRKSVWKLVKSVFTSFLG